MLAWDVSNGVARRSWAGNSNARLCIENEMRRQSGLQVTVPSAADRELVETYVGVAGEDEPAMGESEGAAKARTGGPPPSPTKSARQVTSLPRPFPVSTACQDSLNHGACGNAASSVSSPSAPSSPSHLRLLLLDCRVATMAESSGVPYGLIEDGAVGVTLGGKIALVCPRSELPVGAIASALEVRYLGGGLVTPGLIDCHTHLVYGGAEARVREWELKLGGASYEEIAKAGGGIAATVEGTRSASTAELVETAAPRVAALMRDGVTTIEIKSGYGLDEATERRQLQAAGELGAAHRTPDARAHCLVQIHAQMRKEKVQVGAERRAVAS